MIILTKMGWPKGSPGVDFDYAFSGLRFCWGLAAEPGVQGLDVPERPHNLSCYSSLPYSRCTATIIFKHSLGFSTGASLPWAPPHAAHVPATARRSQGGAGGCLT